MKTGLVKWFNTQKGYGFIKPVDGGFDVYVHIKTVQRAGWVELKEGQKICFDSVVDERTGEIIAENSERPAPSQSARGSTPVDRRRRGSVLTMPTSCLEGTVGSYRTLTASLGFSPRTRRRSVISSLM